MQESRLFKIIYHLLNKGTSTAPELAEKFEVSVRTIYRDIDVISSVGIPIYATQGKGGGITIANDYILNKSLLSSAEKEQVLMALQGLIATENNTGDLLVKLGSLFQAPNINWIEIDFSNWVKGKTNEDIFNELKTAIFGKNMIQIQYFGGDKAVSIRKVAPLKLVFKSKDWYLYGFCQLRNDYRFFKLTRMRSVEIQTETFTDDIVTPCQVIKQANMQNTVSVLLKFDKRIAFRVYDEFTDDVIEDEHGDLYVRTYLPDNDMLYSYILSFENYVEVIEPCEVRELIKQKILEISNKYST